MKGQKCSKKVKIEKIELKRHTCVQCNKTFDCVLETEIRPGWNGYSSRM